MDNLILSVVSIVGVVVLNKRLELSYEYYVMCVMKFSLCDKFMFYLCNRFKKVKNFMNIY